MFFGAVAPDIAMSPGRFPLEQRLSREAGLISMARNAPKNMGRLPQLLLGRSSPDGSLDGVGKVAAELLQMIIKNLMLKTGGMSDIMGKVYTH